MRRQFRFTIACASLAAFTTLGCGGSDLVLPGEPPSTSPPPGASRIQALVGDAQVGSVGTTLPLPLSVKVTNDAGDPVPGVTVGWTAPDGGNVSAGTTNTNTEGVAQVLRTLGPTPGPYTTRAEVAGLSGSPVLFTSTATTSTGSDLPPVALSDEYSSTEGSDHTLTVGAAAGVLQNDRDPEGGALTASHASDPPNGRVDLNSDGSFSYTPVSNFFGDDQFTYRASDGSGNSSTAMVTIHVAPVNDIPRFTDRGDRSARAGDGPQDINDWARNITPGASNESDQTLEFIVIGNSNPDLFTSGGQPAVTRNAPQSDQGTLTYTPSGQTGKADITVVLQDNGGTANGGLDTSVPHGFTIEIKH